MNKSIPINQSTIKKIYLAIVGLCVSAIQGRQEGSLLTPNTLSARQLESSADSQSNSLLNCINEWKFWLFDDLDDILATNWKLETKYLELLSPDRKPTLEDHKKLREEFRNLTDQNKGLLRQEYINIKKDLFSKDLPGETVEEDDSKDPYGRIVKDGDIYFQYLIEKCIRYRLKSSTDNNSEK